MSLRAFNGTTYTAAEMQTEAARQANTGPDSPTLASGGSVAENSAGGTVVATLQATDADGDTLSYTLTDAGGAPVTDSNFEIVGNEIRVKAGADLDFEGAETHGLYVTASDTFETSTPQAITVTVTDTAEVLSLADGGAVFTDTDVAETSFTTKFVRLSPV
ncbi:MAG: cadherin repeat domain-containing protein, partial [Pseudomonadota bacterium]